MRIRFARHSVLILALALIGGCTRYEYSVLEPVDQPLHVGGKEARTIEQEPLVYRLQTVDEHLVMRIFNPTEGPVQLVGNASYVVDPAGQSHPLASMTIAPQSYGKLVFPPLPTRIERRGPSIGFGLGVGISSAHPSRRPLHHPVYDEPRYYYIYQDSAPSFWEWSGESTVRINLAYEADERTFRHQFVIRRVKVK